MKIVEMSYLDKPMTKESYFEHIRSMSVSHRTQTRIALDWFDKFLIGKFDGKTEKIILADLMKQKYSDPQRHSTNLFNVLQDFINYLGVEGQDPSTIRGNFNLVKNYLNWYGFEIYTESVKARLKFQKKIEEEAYPLTIDDVKKILDNSKEQRKALYLFLTSTGCRISESIQIRKRDLDFSFDRIMVRIAGKYTKTKKPRKTFVTKEAEGYLMPILKKIKDDDLIFGTNENHLKSKHNEEEHFSRNRIRAGLQDLKYDNGIHKITLHSFRSWFVTKCNRVDSDFGNALAGHSRYMKRYNRFTDEELCQLFIKAEPSLSIFENVDSNENIAKIQELQAKLENLENEREENKGLRSDLEEFRKRLDLLTASKET